MEAILLVGGKGTRLLPLTIDTAKPMLKVAGVPFIAHQIGYAKEHGISRIIVATSYKNEQFLDFLGDGSRFGIEIVHAIEEVPLGTGGAIANATTRLHSSASEPVAVLNGDILSAHDISAQISLHQRMQADVTLHLIEVEDARAYGSVPIDHEGRILQFVEKSENPPSRLINAGCYIFTRAIVDAIPQGQIVSVERETFPNLLAEKKRLWSFTSNEYWIDIGTPAALKKASVDLLTGLFRSPAVSSATTFPGQRFIDPRARIDSTVQVSIGSAVGAATVAEGVVIERSMIGDGVQIGAGVQISDSIIGDGVVVGSGAFIDRCIFGGRTTVVAPNSRHLGEGENSSST